MLILQSAPEDAPRWVKECCQRTRLWAQHAGYDYRWFDDELFSLLPSDYHAKVAERGPIKADLARLLWIRALLDAGHQTVVWIDADSLILNLDWRLPEPAPHSLFGMECWVQRDSGGLLRVYRQPHNAFCLFRANSPVLDFLTYATESIIRRADPAQIAPQMVGPKLIKALHNLVQFDVLEEAGAVSPEVLTDWQQGGGEALAVFRTQSAVPQLVNLCHSLQRGEVDINLLLSQRLAGMTTDLRGVDCNVR